VKIAIRPVKNKILFLKFLVIGLVSYIFLIYSLYSFRWFESLASGTICLFKTFTQKPCLFCGTTTSILHSFRLNLVSGFLENPAGVLIFLLFIGLFISAFFEVVTKKSVSINLSKNEKVVIAAVVIVLLLTNWFFKLKEIL